MIKLIQIKNYSLIEDSSIELDPHFNVITGETGAGKSLFLSAISLMLGEKVDTKLIKNKDKETSVLIEINPSAFPKLISFLKEHDLDSDVFILKRTFSEASSRSFINDQPVSGSTVKDLMKDLVVVASQNESSQITNKDRQYLVVDSFITKDKKNILTEFKEEYKKYKNLIKELEDKKESLKHKDFNVDYIDFQLSEIVDSNISEDDLEILNKISELKKKAELFTVLNSITPLIHGEDSISGKIRDLQYFLDKIEKKGFEIKNKDSLIQAKDILSEFIKENSSVLSPNTDEESELSSLTDRFESLSKILRKYGPTIQDVLKKKEEFSEKKKNAKSLEYEILNLEKRIDQSLETCKTKALSLSKIRTKTIPSLEKEVTSQLQDLNMKGAEFKIQIDRQELNAYGVDKLDFLIKPHSGQDPLPISKIASGGELSRILLAINSVIETNGCYLFDEIDSGIGGNTGIKIGEKLELMGKKNQIICITHLHQVAVYSDKHFKIEKIQSKDKTKTEIFELDSSSQELEISRMLGDDLSKDSIVHAKQLLKNAKTGSKK